MKRWIGLLAAGALVGSMSACGGSGSGSSASGTTTLTVFAASSLTETFTELGKRFEAQHQGVKVTFDFGGSSDLVAQLQQGAPADVFASADTADMDIATKNKLVAGEPVDFATNTLEIAVPPDNPAHVTSFQDLAGPKIDVVVCAPEVPCGAAARQMEKNTGVKIRPVSEEQSVADVLTKVESGEADAGIVYVTDVKGAGSKVEGVPFKESKTVVNTYPIAPLSSSGHASLAKQFVDLVTGPTGQQALQAAGFGKP
jgi:molybdate transport system substrate-binding protein